jgi:hypothetical protein
MLKHLTPNQVATRDCQMAKKNNITQSQHFQESKACSICNRDKPFSAYRTDKTRPLWTSPQCRDCLNKKDRLKRQAKTPLANNRRSVNAEGRVIYDTEAINQRLVALGKEKYAKTKEAVSLYWKAMYQKNKEVKKSQSRNWLENNREAANKQHNQRRKFRRLIDPSYKLSDVLRGRLLSILSRQAQIRVGSAVRDLGCSVSELKTYIESKFLLGMSWANHGNGRGDKGLCEWQLDHIIPLASFNLTDREQFLRACHYTNLQPLWAEHNRIKNDRLVAC